MWQLSAAGYNITVALYRLHVTQCLLSRDCDFFTVHVYNYMFRSVRTNDLVQFTTGIIHCSAYAHPCRVVLYTRCRIFDKYKII